MGTPPVKIPERKLKARESVNSWYAHMKPLMNEQLTSSDAIIMTLAMVASLICMAPMDKSAFVDWIHCSRYSVDIFV
jgi:hypothetical protein